MPTLLRVEPSSLHVHVHNGVVISSVKLELINISDDKVAYKIKCTDVKKFKLNKSQGALKRGTKDVILIEVLDCTRSTEIFSILFGPPSSSTLSNEVRIPCTIVNDQDMPMESGLRLRAPSTTSSEYSSSAMTYSFLQSSDKLAFPSIKTPFSSSYLHDDTASNVMEMMPTRAFWSWQGKLIFSVLFLCSVFVLLLPSPGAVVLTSANDEFSLQYWLDHCWPLGLRPTCWIRCISAFVLGCLVTSWFKS